MINLSAVSLLDLLPPNLASDHTIFAAAKAIDAEHQSTTALIAELSIFDRLDSLSPEEADELAWQYHVDFYDQALPIERRRELVKNSFKWHKIKGTPAAVEELIETVFGDGQVTEWFEYGGEPYMFKVISSNTDITDAQAQQFIAALNTVKRESAHLEAIVLTDTSERLVYYGFGVHTGDYISLKQEGA